MVGEAQEKHPARQRLADLVEMSLKRCERAAWKLGRAQLEADASAEALTAARQGLDAWDAANPDPQLSLIEAIHSNGGIA